MNTACKQCFDFDFENIQFIQHRVVLLILLHAKVKDRIDRHRFKECLEK